MRVSVTTTREQGRSERERTGKILGLLFARESAPIVELLPEVRYDNFNDFSPKKVLRMTHTTKHQPSPTLSMDRTLAATASYYII